MPINLQIQSRDEAESSANLLPDDCETDAPPIQASIPARQSWVRPSVGSRTSNVAHFPTEPRIEPHLNERSAAQHIHFAYEPLKRVFDILIGFMLLIPALPIIFVAALAIKLETPGSPFFVQTRLGRNGRPFKIFKLRGMYIDARTRFPSFYDFTGKQNLDFCFHHEVDPRITRAGKFIRRTSIDELPNLWNVLLGDMSLVGPRPEIPEVLALYGAYREEYLSIKPGVTCVSKCTGRDRLTKRETIEFDLRYIRERSLRLDLAILWRTFRSVVLRQDVF
jgi:lipopolysaccharide/colanic/teichoic acid biosynthesis glycosyltransferase